MEYLSEAQARALEPTLGSATSPASRRAVRSLAALQPAFKENRLVCYALWDLGNLVRCALASGAPSNTRCGEDDSPVLCLVASLGAARSLKALLIGGADVRLANKKGYTALHRAAQKGDTTCIALLLDAGAPLEAQTSSGQTPLCVVAYAVQSEAVALLLERGANANSMDRAGNTPLVNAVVNKHIRCFELLLPHTDLSIMNSMGRNAFHMSLTTASYDCFKLLLPRMADVDVRTIAGVDAAGAPQPFNLTAAHLACDRGEHKMLEKLLRRSASRTARDSVQMTPLHYAAMSGQLSCIVQLIGHPEAYKLAPADINAADVDGWTPLHYAARHDQAECCGLLIAAGARLDARIRSGHTPLMLAQHFHPTSTALHDLLAGRGPERLPGTTCDCCGCPEDPASHLMPCSGCQVARYCSIACQHAAWEAHEAECGRLKVVREHNSRVILVQSIVERGQSINA